MESPPSPVVNSLARRSTGELLAFDSPFTPGEIERLFESESPLLRESPYALSAPPNTVRARRSDWRVFIRFCVERHFTALPATPVIVREFIETSFGGDQPRSAATVERYLSTIAHAHALSNLPDPTKTAHVKGAYRHLARGKPGSQPKAALRGAHIAHALEHLHEMLLLAVAVGRVAHHPEDERLVARRARGAPRQQRTAGGPSCRSQEKFRSGPTLLPNLHPKRGYRTLP